VAEITPGMEILTSSKGVLLENRNQEVVENSGSYPNFHNLSKIKSPDYSARKKITAEKKYANARFIVSDLVPVDKVTNLFEDQLGTRGPMRLLRYQQRRLYLHRLRMGRLGAAG
jgi:hypothetical protein